jgi:hypothetical protein
MVMAEEKEEEESPLETDEPAERRSRESPANKSVLARCELLGLLIGLPFGEDLCHSTPVTGWHVAKARRDRLF